MCTVLLTRQNCLYASYMVAPNETCIVSRAWFEQKWGLERFMNVRHPCCDYAQEQSNYTIAHLASLMGLNKRNGTVSDNNANAVRFHFLRGAGKSAVTREPSLAALQRSSGGNALIAAIALCKRVRLFGAGLYATSPTDDKVRGCSPLDKLCSSLTPRVHLFLFSSLCRCI